MVSLIWQDNFITFPALGVTVCDMCHTCHTFLKGTCHAFPTVTKMLCHICDMCDTYMGLPQSCWAHLAGTSGWKNIYLGLSILIIIYPAISTSIWGWDGMDGGRSCWMMFPFWEVSNIYQMWLYLDDL